MSKNNKRFEILSSTFSVAGKCERTGAFGAITTTSSPAVGARVIQCKSGTGVVLSQNMTDPRLAKVGMNILELGYDAKAALAAMEAVTDYPDYRQLATLDKDGNSAAFTGKKAFGPHQGEFCGKNVVSIGNYICDPAIPEAMAKQFMEDEDMDLTERLLKAIEVGFEMGGEIGPEYAIAIQVYTDYEFPYVDLRVDYQENPLDALKELWALWKVQADVYERTVIDPETRYKEREIELKKQGREW